MYNKNITNGKGYTNMRAVGAYENNINLMTIIAVRAACTHENVHIEKACCSTVGESGYFECGCGGRDSIACDNPNCDGISDLEFEKFFEKLDGGGSDCE